MVERKPSNPIRAFLTESNFPKLEVTTRNLINVFNGILCVAFFAGGNCRKLQNADFSVSGCKNGMQKIFSRNGFRTFSALDGRARFPLLLVRYFRLPRSHKTTSSCVITS